MKPSPDRPEPPTYTQEQIDAGQRAGVMRIGGEAGTIPAWYLVEVTPDQDWSFTTRVEMDDDERAAIAAGADIMLTLYRAEVPWMITVAP